MSSRDTDYSDKMMFHALYTQFRMVNQWLEDHPVQGDLMTHQVNLNGRPYVTQSSELLEQSLKALVMVSDHTYTSQRMRDDGHRLSQVFRRLKHQDSNHLCRGYTTFRSLHNYLTYTTLDEFVTNVSSDYVKWRYYPLEGWANGTPAITCPYALLEVLRHSLDVLKVRVGLTDHGLQTVDKRIHFQIAHLLNNPPLFFAPTGSSDEPEPTNILEEWVESNGSLINAFSAAIRRHKKHGAPLKDQIPALIVAHVDNAMQRMFSSENHDLRQFLHRAVHDQSPLEWDSQSNTFINRPCSVVRQGRI